MNPPNVVLITVDDATDVDLESMFRRGSTRELSDKPDYAEGRWEDNVPKRRS